MYIFVITFTNAPSFSIPTFTGVPTFSEMYLFVSLLLVPTFTDVPTFYVPNVLMYLNVPNFY